MSSNGSSVFDMIKVLLESLRLFDLEPDTQM